MFAVVVDKLADYEDELRMLKSSTSPTAPELPVPQPKSRSASPRPPPPTTNPSTRTLPSRLTNFLSSSPPTTTTALASAAQKRSHSQPPANSPPQNPSTPLTPNYPPAAAATAQLQALLSQEQTLRMAAERRVTQTNTELEELSAQLFTEANEMVATERKARAKLEQRVEILENREKEKAGRLDLLERRVSRVERVRGLLAQQVVGGVGLATGIGVPGPTAGIAAANNVIVPSSTSVAGAAG